MANFINSDEENFGLFSEINVTPMVDVMLVLLIIFMVTAPFMTNTIGVNLPKGMAHSTENFNVEPLTISIDKENNIFIAQKKLSLEELGIFLKNSPRIKNNEEVFIEADTDVRHGYLVSVMSMANESGVEKINILMEKK